MKIERIPEQGDPFPPAHNPEQSLRNRIAARMLLAGLVPVAVIYGLRAFWTNSLGMPEDSLSYQMIVASLVLILSSALASFFSRGMVGLLRSEEKARRDEPGTTKSVDGGTTDADREKVAAFLCLLERGRDAVLLVDHSEGRVSGTSRKFREIFGFDGEGSDPLSYSEVKTCVVGRFTDSERVESAWGRLGGSGAKFEGEQWSTSGTDRREFVVHSERLAGSDVRVWIFVDITDELALTAERVRSQRQESIGALAGGVAHDFNNMLAGVMGNLALAEIDGEEGAAPAGARPHLDLARVAGLRAVELARHLTRYSGGGKGGKWCGKVGELMREVEKLLRPGLAGDVKFTLEMTEDAESRALSGDAREIEQVLVNLCTDARTALQGQRDGEITLSARVRATTGRLEILIRDNRQEATSTEIQGISEAIVRRHGGRLHRRREDGGAMVSVLDLPCVAEAETADEAPRPGIAGRTRLDSRGGEMILVVDDEEVVRSVGEKMLRHRGYAVRVAVDGRDALDQYDADPGAIDAVLLDLTMPRLSGAATFRMLKERAADLPIIVCSGYEVDADEFESENGWRPDGILAKPYDFDGIDGVIRRALDARAEVFLDSDC